MIGSPITGDPSTDVQGVATMETAPGSGGGMLRASVLYGIAGTLGKVGRSPPSR